MFGNGIPTIEKCFDGVRLTFHLQTAMGRPDEQRVFEIRYADIAGLSYAPPLDFDSNWTLEERYVDVGTQGGGLRFIYRNYMETYSGAWSEEIMIGPYRWQDDRGIPPLVLSVYEEEQEGIGFKELNLILSLYAGKNEEQNRRERKRLEIVEDERLELSRLPKTELESRLWEKFHMTDRCEQLGLPKGPYFSIDDTVYDAIYRTP